MTRRADQEGLSPQLPLRRRPVGSELNVQWALQWASSEPFPFSVVSSVSSRLVFFLSTLASPLPYSPSHRVHLRRSRTQLESFSDMCPLHRDHLPSHDSLYIVYVLCSRALQRTVFICALTLACDEACSGGIRPRSISYTTGRGKRVTLGHVIAFIRVTDADVSNARVVLVVLPFLSCSDSSCCRLA